MTFAGERQQSQFGAPSSIGTKARKDKKKEPSAREKALEFARNNIPRPKPKPKTENVIPNEVRKNTDI